MKLPLPRPLVIVLVIIIVLSVVGCGVSVLRGGEQGSSDQDKKAELRNGGLTDIFSRFAPPSEPVTLAPANSACLQSNGNLQFSGTCVVSIPATDALRRSLRLKLVGVSMSMQVTVVTGGESEPSETASVTPSSEDASVVLARGDSAVVTLGCNFPPCTVLVNPQ